MEKFQRTKDYWNATLYDQNHSFVSEYGNDLIELLAPKPGEKILDLGCGTGDLAKKLYDGGVSVTGVDNSKNMIAEALSKYPQIRFLVRDATSLGYSAEFDAVFSNATLHWIKQPNQALNSIFQSLKPNGRFVAEFGGKGNVQTITEEVIHQLTEEGIGYNPDQFPWYFPSIGEYTSLMEKAGFKVVFAQHFDRPTPLNGENGLKNWIEMFGGYMFEKVDEDKKQLIIAEAGNNLKSALWKDGSWTADYKRIRVIGIKE